MVLGRALNSADPLDNLQEVDKGNVPTRTYVHTFLLLSSGDDKWVQHAALLSQTDAWPAWSKAVIEDLSCDVTAQCVE